MRGDLVYEKLGEIDPALVADALPDAVPLVSVNSLTTPPKPPRGTVWRRVAVIAACILLAGLLAVGGGAWLFQDEAKQPWETDTTDESDISDTNSSDTVQTPQDSEEEPPETVPELHGYEGDFLIYDTSGTKLLYVGNKPEHEDEIREIIAILNRAVEPDTNPVASVCHFEMTVGDTALGAVFGTLVDKTNGGRYGFAEGDWARFYQLIKTICGYFPDGPVEDPAGIVCESVVRHRGDAYEISAMIYNDMYTLDDLVLVHKRTGYRIPLQISFGIDSYVCTIPEDAPTGYYYAVASFGTPYSDRKFTVQSRDPAVNLQSHSKEPAYTFACDLSSIEALYHYGDTLSLDASFTNLGDDLYRYGSNTVLHPKAELRIRRGDETLSFEMTDEMISEDGGRIRSLPSGKQGESGGYTLLITEDMPVGMYDLVLSFEGHEQVFENVLEINDTLVLCRGDSYGLFVSQAEPSTFVLRQGDYEIPFSRWDNLPVVTIPADAPAGSYDLVENGYLSFEGFLIVSDAENEYLIRKDLTKQTVQRGDWVEFSPHVDVEKAVIHAFMPYDNLNIETVLVARYGSDTYYTLTAMDAPDAREPNNYTFYPGESIIKSKTFIIPDDMPAGSYDLVVTFRGKTVTYPSMITVVIP